MILEQCAPASTCKASLKSASSYIYAMTHPVWPKAVYVGRTNRPRERLNRFNLEAPLRLYRFIAISHVEDGAAVEKELRVLLAAFRMKGNWYEVHHGLIKFLIRHYGIPMSVSDYHPKQQ